MSWPIGRLSFEVVAGPAALISLCAVAVVVFGVVEAARRPRHAARSFAAHAGFALELFLAVGLIRLAALDTLRALGMVAAIIAIRQVIGRGLRAGAPSLTRTSESIAHPEGR